MTVAADVMSKDVITVAPDMSISEVARIILNHKVTSLPVVDGEGRLVGIVSEGDLVRCSKSKRDAHRSWWLTLMAGTNADQADVLGQGDRRVGDVMSKDVLLASETESLSQLIELLSRRRIKRLPIVKNGKLVGIVSRVDVLRHLASSRSLRRVA
ncbi:MAG: CBS domain-containing protein [Pseudomonadota bacterium]